MQKGGQLLGKLISRKHAEKKKKKTGEVTQLPEVITFPLFISLFTCGCVQGELIEIPERKHLNWNPITSRPGLLAGLVNMYVCTAPDK